MKKSIKGVVVFSLALFMAGCELTDPLSDAPNINLEGTWMCDENSQVYPDSNPFDVIIYADFGNDSTFKFHNFYQYIDNVKGIINGTTITIPRQQIGEDIISGSGTVNSSFTTMNLSYQIDLGVKTDNVSATLKKQ